MDKKKATAAAAVAAIITSSSAAVEANFDNPADLLQSTNVEPKVQYIGGDDVQDNDGLQDEDKQKAKEEKSTFRSFILGLPLVVRVFFVLPQWFIGNAIVYAGGLIFAGTSPILSGIVGFLLLVLVMGAAFTITAKAIFPDLPLKKILNRHTIKWILIGSAAVYLADLLLGIFWAGYAHFKTMITGGMTLVVLGSIVIWFARRENRRRIRLEEKKLQNEREQLLNDSDELVYQSLGQTFVIKK